MKRTLLILAGLLLTCHAHALKLAGVHLPDTAQIGSQALVLNGAGVRTKWFFKVYVGALYLPQKEASGAAVMADERAHRMAMHMLHALGSGKLFDAFDEAFAACHTPEEMEAMEVQLGELKRIFAAVEQVHEGDVITLDYAPGVGTQISVNEALRGTIAGAAFNRALLKIWLGDKPVQEDLKKGLLGG